jgi:hypothetical protein
MFTNLALPHPSPALSVGGGTGSGVRSALMAHKKYIGLIIH